MAAASRLREVKAKRDVGLFLAAVAFAVAAPSSPTVAVAGASGPATPVPLPDPSAVCAPVPQHDAVQIFDTRELEGKLAAFPRLGHGPHYVNDHTLVRGHDGRYHLFGIFHAEPMGEDNEIDFIHAVATETDPAKWEHGVFHVAPPPYTFALTADRSAGETHLWAPHVIEHGGRWLMIYQGGGPDAEHVSFRLAESDDLYRWTRIGSLPVFEDFCDARDPMIVKRDGVFSLYYTRCESQSRRVSGVAHRLSRDLVHWSEPKMALTLSELTVMPNSGFTESPFVFSRGGYHYLSVTAYPLGWDTTLLYRSRAPFAFPDEPYARLRAHAAEWVFDARGAAYVTHAGPGQRGVWLSAVDL